MIEYDIKTIKNIFFEGMNIASLKGNYYPNAKEELDEILEEKQNSNILEIVNHFHSINEMLRDKMYKEQAEDLFKCIPMKMDNFYEKFDREAMNKPVFKYYDMHQMFQRISCASNEDIVQIKEKLTERAKKNKEVVKLEIPNLISLKQIINEYIKGKAINIKIVMLEEFAKQLDEIIKENS